MPEAVPHRLGQLLGGIRAGHQKLAIADPAMRELDLASFAFAGGARLPSGSPPTAKACRRR
jgi:hypothetical protein